MLQWPFSLSLPQLTLDGSQAKSIIDWITVLWQKLFLWDHDRVFLSQKPTAPKLPSPRRALSFFTRFGHLFLFISRFSLVAQCSFFSFPTQSMQWKLLVNAGVIGFSVSLWSLRYLSTRFARLFIGTLYSSFSFSFKSLDISIRILWETNLLG